MLLESIEVHNLRNLSGEVFWGDGLNIILGENAQGKTNWLEAIYLLATTKSFRTQRPQEAIRFGEDLAVVRGRVTRSPGVHRDLQVTLQGSIKAISLNGKREAVANYLSQLHVVSFTADELDVVRGGPDARRRFLDRGVVSLHHSYVQTLAVYGRGDSDYMAQVRSEVAAHQLPVEFLPISNMTKELPAVYRRHDALLYTAEWNEPFSVTPIEAMASGLPVIGSCIGGAGEIFREEQNALTYAPGDSETLASRMLLLQQNPQLRCQIAETAQQEVLSRLNESAVTDRIEAYLQSALGDKPEQ